MLGSLHNRLARAEEKSNPNDSLPHPLKGIAVGIQKQVEQVKGDVSSAIETKVVELKKEVEVAISDIIDVVSAISESLVKQADTNRRIEKKLDLLLSNIEVLKNAPVIVEPDAAFSKNLEHVVLLVQDLKNVNLKASSPP